MPSRGRAVIELPGWWAKQSPNGWQQSMADNSSYRPSRAGSSSARGDTGSPDGGRAGGTDPLLELARLIGQDDGLKTIVRDSGRDVAQYDPAPHEDDRRTPNWLNDNGPAAPHRSDERDADEYDPRYVRPPVAAPHDAEPYESDARSGDVTVPEHDHDAGYYGDDDQMLDEGYDEAPPERRRAVVTIIAAVVGLAVVGTAGAFGYRAWSGGTGPAGEPPLIKADTAPSKIVPATQGENGSKFSYGRVGGQGPGSGGEKMASREERPVDVRPPTPRVILPGNHQKLGKVGNFFHFWELPPGIKITLPRPWQGRLHGGEWGQCLPPPPA